ncbi:MAG TPA: DUF1127 domain-containing protein [Desulfuromonadales bacterium]|nr:DUF1127 domain-containing protein [Desulfuromonadales bacterium]
MLSTSLLARTWNRLKIWNEVSRQRRELIKLSDYMLKDLGLSRADVERESHRPFWETGPSRDRTLRRHLRTEEPGEGKELIRELCCRGC